MICPECQCDMEDLGVEVEYDERTCGDGSSGDSELGSSASRTWICPSCGHETNEDLGFRGTGVLR